MQRSAVVAALAANKRLASAPDWPSFELFWGEPTSMDVAFAPESFGVGALERLRSLAPALARGMELLSQQQLDASSLHQHVRGMALLLLLYSKWAACVNELARISSSADKERAFVQLAVQVTRTGMLKAYEQLSGALARFISSPGAQPQPQQQQQQAASEAAAVPSALQQSGLAELITTLLWWFGGLIVHWPGGKALSNLGVAGAVPAVAELAMAALRNKHAHWGPLPSSGSGSSSGDGSSSSERVCSSGSAGNSVAATVAILARAIYTATPPGVVGIAGSGAGMQLLICCLALTAQAIHHQQHGLRPAAAAAGTVPSAAARSTDQHQQQQLAVPPFHTQLQQALELAGDSEDLLLLGPHPSPDMAVLPVSCVRFHDRSTSSSTSSSSSTSRGSSSSTSRGSRGNRVQSSCIASTPEQQQQQQQLVAGPSVDVALLAPLLMTLLECSALLAEQSTSATCLEVMGQLLASCRRLDCIPEALVRSLPPVMLQLLLPVIRHVDATAAAGAPASRTFAGASGQVLLQLVNSVVLTALQRGARGSQWLADSTLRALAAVFLQQPQAYSALMEAAVRDSLQKRAWLGPCHLGLLLGAAAIVSDDDRITLSMADQQQLFPLMISCCKTASAAAAADDTGEAHQTRTFAAEVLLLSAHYIFGAHPLLMAHSSSSSQGHTAADDTPTSSNSSRNQLAVHLLGRFLVSAGNTLLLANSISSSSSISMSIIISESGLLQGVTKCTNVLAEQLPQLSPALPDPLLQQLLDEQTALQQQLEAQLTAAAEAAEVNAGVTPGVQQLSPAVVSVGQQLEAFGAAVAAQVPLKHCCNHHGCTNTSKNSELELVGGKSCVCGGCKAARYCSRECQVAHYKGWHKAVCKRLQQQQQRQAEGHVA